MNKRKTRKQFRQNIVGFGVHGHIMMYQFTHAISLHAVDCTFLGFTAGGMEWSTAVAR